MGKGRCRILHQTGGRKGDPVKERQKGTKKEKSREDTAREGRERKPISDWEVIEPQISDLRSQLDQSAPSIVAKHNDLERLDKEKEELQQAYNRVKQRMLQIEGMLWKEGVWYRGTDARGGRKLIHKW